MSMVNAVTIVLDMCMWLNILVVESRVHIMCIAYMYTFCLSCIKKNTIEIGGEHMEQKTSCLTQKCFVLVVNLYTSFTCE